MKALEDLLMLIAGTGYRLITFNRIHFEHQLSQASYIYNIINAKEVVPNERLAASSSE
jgi:hypothetical protein